MGQPRDDDDDDGDRGLNDSKWLEKWLLNRRFALTWKSKSVVTRRREDGVSEGRRQSTHKCTRGERMSNKKPHSNEMNELWRRRMNERISSFVRPLNHPLRRRRRRVSSHGVCLCFKSLAGCARPLHCNCSTHKFSPLLHAAVDLHACYDRLVGLFCVCFDKWDFMGNSHGDGRPRWWCTKGYHRCAEVSLYMVVAF